MKRTLRKTLFAICLFTMAHFTNAQNVFYAMTDAGGTHNGGAYGTIFKFDPATSTETVEWSFGGAGDALYGYGDLVYDANNQLFYVLAFAGGAHAGGALCTFNPTTNAEAVVWSFGSGTDGSTPLGALTYDASNGLFYGTTQNGGANSKGTIFSFNPTTNTEAVVYSFASTNDGTGPRGTLVYNAANHLYYGMTELGGGNSKGTIFSFNPTTNAEAVVWSLGSGSDGAQPWGELTYDAVNGLFYAMTSAGGSHGTGAIISFNPTTNAEALVWSFGGAGDGTSPYGDLIYDANTTLFYGLTYSGGANASGAIISFNPGNNTETVLKSLVNGTDGEQPYGSFTYDRLKNRYYANITQGGNAGGYGTIISFNPVTNQDSVMYNFTGTPDGYYPRDRILIYPPITLSVNEAKGESSTVNVYPNPSNGVFQIQANSYQLIANSQIEVYNMLGEKVYSTEILNLKSQFSINLCNQPAGVYLYRVLTNNGNLVSTGKLIIQK